MKRLGGIWPKLVSFENLLLAYRKARRGKRDRPGVAEFGLNLEWQLIALQRDLENGAYQPSDYRLFTIYERKPRVIAAASFRDRVVHHAVMNLIEPALDRTFISDSYACRIGKGVHAAVDRYQAWAQTYRYALKLDVQQYFPSIDHELLKTKLRQRIKDRRALGLLDRIIDGSPAGYSGPQYFPGDDLFSPLQRRVGIPVGNLTSQFFANLFLDDLDHYIKHRLGIRPYLRYVDDMVVCDNDKDRLAEIRAVVRERLQFDRLRLHPNKAHITPTAAGLNLLGYLVFPNRRRLRSDNGHRFERKLRGLTRAYASGRADWVSVKASVQSWIGHAKHADTEALRTKIFSQAVFIRGTGQATGSVCCAAAPGTYLAASARPSGTGSTPAAAAATSVSVSPRTFLNPLVFVLLPFSAAQPHENFLVNRRTRFMPPNIPQAVPSCREHLLWLVPRLDKLPGARRFTLGNTQPDFSGGFRLVPPCDKGGG